MVQTTGLDISFAHIFSSDVKNSNCLNDQTKVAYKILDISLAYIFSSGIKTSNFPYDQMKVAHQVFYIHIRHSEL